MLSLLYVQSQSIQSARLSIQSSDLSPPTSSPARDWFPPPPLVVKGGRHTPLQGRGWGDPIRTMGQTLTLGIL